MIEIQKVGKSFSGQRVLEDITILIQPGTIHGIIGENGVGKSTLLQMLAGIYEVEEGCIQIEGERVYENNTIKSKVAYVADRNQFLEGYKGKDMLSFFKHTYDDFSETKFNQYNAIFKVDMSKKMSQLSKGMQMRLAFMLQLAKCPTYMILDEPTSGLDAMAKKQMLDLLISEVEERQMTVVIATHHLSEIEKICDEITILKAGKILYQSNLEGLKEEVKKLQIVFDKVPDKLHEWEEWIHVEQVGRVCYVTTKNYSALLEEKLKANGASSIEEIGLNLEEIFICANVEKGVAGNEN